MSNAHGLADPEWTPELKRYWAKRLPGIVIPETKQRVEPKPAPRPTIKGKALAHRIIWECADYCGVPETMLTITGRSRHAIFARNAAIYLVMTHAGMVRGGVAQIFRRDPSTISHTQIDVAADLAANGAKFGEIVAHVETKMGLR
jgi:hypothetical protein